MRRTDLTEATMQGWARLDAAQLQQFFEAFLNAALRLDKLELRAWLRRRLKNQPFAAFDPACLMLGDADIALILRSMTDGTARVHTKERPPALPQAAHASGSNAQGGQR
jgi:hypothetical protein